MVLGLFDQKGVFLLKLRSIFMWIRRKKTCFPDLGSKASTPCAKSCFALPQFAFGHYITAYFSGKSVAWFLLIFDNIRRQ
jgi:hypothetical protein